jgi:hypothetical protein
MIDSIINAIKEEKKAAIMLAIFVPLMIGFLVHVYIFKKRQDEKYNQFIHSPEGKALIVQYLFHCENIDAIVFERYLKSKKIPLVNQNPDLIYRGEIVLQYALDEINSVPAHFKGEFISIIKASPQSNIGIGSVFYEEYQRCESLEEKVAIIKAYIKLNTPLSDKAREKRGDYGSKLTINSNKNKEKWWIEETRRLGIK